MILPTRTQHTQRGAAQGGSRPFDFRAVEFVAKHLVLCRIERRQPRLDLDIYPYLPKAVVETTRPASYKVLMSGVAA